MKNTLSLVAIALSIVSIGLSLSNRIDVSEFAKTTDVDASDKKIEERVEFYNKSRNEVEMNHFNQIFDLTKDVRLLREKVGMSEDVSQSK
jgi:hypothetical protein